MRGFVILLAVIGSLTVSCRRLPDIQGKGDDFIQGVWGQDTVMDTIGLLNFTQYGFKFSCDSFYVELTTHAKVNYYEESCFNDGLWKEYAKGTYLVHSDTLFLVGTFTKSNFRQKISGCYRIGQYLERFKIRSIEKGKISLENTDDQREVNLILKEDIICVPKPI